MSSVLIQANGKSLYRLEIEEGINPESMVRDNPMFDGINIVKFVWVPKVLMNLCVSFGDAEELRKRFKK